MVEKPIRRSIQPLSLPGGWSGCACLGHSGVPGLSDENGVMPIPVRFTLDQLQEVAKRIISDPSTLEGYSVLKYSKHGEVFRARVESAGGSVEIVGKRNLAAGWRRQLRAMVRSSRARRNFDQALQLLAVGIPTARPLLLLERRRSHRESWIVTEFVQSLVDLDQLVLVELPKLDRHSVYGAKVRVVDAVVELLVGLHKAGLGHRDFKASNVMISDNQSTDREAKAWMLDLDGLHAIRSGAGSRRWHPVVRLAASLIDYSMVTKTDCARFLRSLLLRQPSDSEWKSRYRDLARQATDYARRAKRRKKDKLDGYGGGV